MTKHRLIIVVDVDDWQYKDCTATHTAEMILSAYNEYDTFASVIAAHWADSYPSVTEEP